MSPQVNMLSNAETLNQCLSIHGMRLPPGPLPTSGKIRAITSGLKCDCLWFPDRILPPSWKQSWGLPGNN